MRKEDRENNLFKFGISSIYNIAFHESRRYISDKESFTLKFVLNNIYKINTLIWRQLDIRGTEGFQLSLEKRQSIMEFQI